jgi:hypothetical protein
LKVAATGAGFSSITNVNAVGARLSPGGRVVRRVTGTIPGVFSACWHLDRDQAGAIGKLPSLEHITGQIGPWIIVLGS